MATIIIGNNFKYIKTIIKQIYKKCSNDKQNMTNVYNL